MYADFYIELNDKRYIIEYNGKQHYMFVDFFHKTISDYELQLRRDKLLKQYCKLNDITFVELKYSLSTNKIEKILTDMLKISFDLDEVTKKISNLKVVSISNEVLESATVEVLDNKLKLSKAAIDMLGASANEKITINYWTVDNELTFPVIGKAEAFTDSDGGNRLTRSNTISYRGQQRDILLEYGSLFTLESFKDGIFKMNKVQVEGDSLDTEKTDLQDLDNIQDLPF